MGELGVGGGQIELLAALFDADAPKDVAPRAYNQDDPPGGLPASPLAPRPDATGFPLDGLDAHHHAAAHLRRRTYEVVLDRANNPPCELVL
jgi:hypothetical protein